MKETTQNRLIILGIIFMFAVGITIVILAKVFK